MRFYDMMQRDPLSLKNMIREEENKKEKRKIKTAFVTKNILCIAFCMIVVIGFSVIFGSENSIVGVVSILGILVFRSVDLGVNKISGTINIAIMFVIYAFSPYISNTIHPALSFFVNIISIAILLILTCHNLLMSNQSTVILSYLLIQGYNVTPAQFPMRVKSVLFGGLIVCIIYFVKHRHKDYRRSTKDLFLEFHHLSFRGRWQIKVAVSLSIVMLCGRLLSLDRTMWLCIACLSVLHPDVDQMYSRLKTRPIFVIVGCILFIAGFYIFPPALFEQIGIVGGLMTGFSGTYQWQTVFNCFGGLSTAISVLGLPMAIFLRIVYNIIGSVFAVIFSKLFDTITNKITCKKQKGNEVLKNE